jgi:hypothetical protein
LASLADGSFGVTIVGMELAVIRGTLDEHFGTLHPKQRQALSLVLFGRTAE